MGPSSAGWGVDADFVPYGPWGFRTSPLRRPFARQTKDEDLRQAFEKFGPLVYCKVMTERDTGRSRYE